MKDSMQLMQDLPNGVLNKKIGRNASEITNKIKDNLTI
jgi:hypothetical protein